MFRKNPIKLNIYVFLFYFFAYFLDLSIDLQVFFYLKIFMGLAVFFIVGMNITLVFEKITKVSLDTWEFVTVGIFVALFLNPLIVFLFYKITKFISGVTTISIFMAITLTLLVINYSFKNESSKN